MALTSGEYTDDEGRQFHIQCKKGDVGKYVLLPGDPFRTDIIAKYFDNPVLVAHNREHKTWTGTLDGEKVSVTSTGMGGPSTAIALEELIHCGADTFIRVGTCGRLGEQPVNGDPEGIVITGAVRDEGTTTQYIPLEYPAMADYHVTEALVQACAAKGFHFEEGLSQSTDGLYSQIFPEGAPDEDKLRQKEKIWTNAGVLATEMESAALFVLAAIRGTRAGAIMAYGEMNDHTIELACDAFRRLIAEDKAQK